MIPYSKAKAIKNRIDHRMTAVEKAAAEMLAQVDDHSLNADAPLRDLRAVRNQLKEIVDRRSGSRLG